MIEILTDNHAPTIESLFDSTKEEITIVSPYLSMPMAKKLCDAVEKNSLKCNFVTRFYLEDMYSKVNSIDAIELMMNTGIKVYALKRLHTKLYLFDSQVGIVGSANFTLGGFKTNEELSIYASDEPTLIEALKKYANDLICFLKTADDGIITKQVIEDARKKYQSLIDNKIVKKITTFSTYVYGADKEKKEMSPDEVEKEIKSGIGKDIMQTIFTEKVEKISFDHTIWLKFAGEGKDRIKSKEKFPIVKVNYNGAEVYIQNYSQGVNSIHKGDEVYLAAITTDSAGRNQPVIVGRGTYIDPINGGKIKAEWISKNKGMDKYPFFCITDSVKILNTEVENGVRLSEVWDALGSNTYETSFGRNETIDQVSIKHRQKAHMKLSGNAKVYLDKRLDELEEEYGFTTYNSQPIDTETH